MLYKKAKRYRYKLHADFAAVLSEEFNNININHAYFSIHEGILSIEAGYFWDGATGPVFQTDTTKIPSLVHDALLQAIEISLSKEKYLKLADKEYLSFALSAGMFPPRAYIHYYAMRYLRPLIWDRLPKRNYEKVYSV